MTVRLQQLTAPFHHEHHDLIQTSIYPLHLSLHPHLATTTCATPADYLTTLQTHCALTQSTLILATLPATAPSLTIAGFALYRSVHDTFNTHRLLLETLVVAAEARRRGVGTVLLRYVQQVARDVGAFYVTVEVPAGWVECQPLLAKHKFAVQALSFTRDCQPRERTQPSLLSPASPKPPSPPTSATSLSASDITTTLINIANFSSPSSTALLTALEPIYRLLRPHPHSSPSPPPPTSPASTLSTPPTPSPSSPTAPPTPPPPPPPPLTVTSPQCTAWPPAATCTRWAAGGACTWTTWSRTRGRGVGAWGRRWWRR